MLRPGTIGASEALTVERLNRVERETLGPAARPRAARLARDNAAPVDERLDRPRCFWSYDALTIRATEVGAGKPFNPIEPVPVATPYAHVFTLPGPGWLRRIACRDILQPNDPTAAGEARRLIVLRQNLGGGTLATWMNGTTSDTLPLDKRDFDLEIGGPSDEQVSVISVDNAGNPTGRVLAVTFEFALDLNRLTFG